MLTRESYFPGHSPEEQVALFIRRHWMAFMPWMIITPLMILVPLVALFFLWSLLGTTPDSRLGLVVGYTIWFLLILFATLRAWMQYYLDVTIVTERRLVDIEQDSIFVRRISEQSLLRVQDVSARQKGFFQHFLNYGSIYIETAGEHQNFELYNIPRPNDVVKTILDLHERLVGSPSSKASSIAEGSLAEDVSEETMTKNYKHRHPLETLRPYFPEPKTAEREAIERPVPAAPRQEIKRGTKEFELKEGETITLSNHSPKR